MTESNITDAQQRLLIEAAKASLENEVVVYVKGSQKDDWIQAAGLLYPFTGTRKNAVKYHSKYWLTFKDFKGRGFSWTTLKPRKGLPGITTFVCPEVIETALPKVCSIMKVCLNYLDREYK